MSNAVITEYDVIISGGGLSGLLTAIGLVNETPELSIAIIEPVSQPSLDAVPNDFKSSDFKSNDFKSDTAAQELNQRSNQISEQSQTANFDDRCLALSSGSLQLLNHWQVWENLKPTAWPIKTIVTSDRGHLGKTIMRSHQYNLNAMGYVAAMKNMGRAFTTTLNELQAALQSNESNKQQVTWYKPNTIKQLSQYPDHIKVVLDDEQTLHGKLLVVAEGGMSPTRQKLNISTSTEAYQQNAIIANIKVTKNNKVNSILASKDRGDSDTNTKDTQPQLDGHTAFERFTTSGPIAFLPINKDEYSVVWCVKPEDVDNIMALQESEFCQQLQNAFGQAAGIITKTSKRESYPLGLTKAQSIISDRVALVGNSAHTIHPIAGQGFNLGLRDVASLVKQIKVAVDSSVDKSQNDIGSFATLNNYQAARQHDINRIAGFTDLLVRMFGLEGRLPALSRTLGLLALQKVSSLQQWFAVHFMSSKTLK
jgi:2-octaprenyl-6-methoxyphenol hydroxylase